MNETQNRAAAAADFCWLRDADQPLPSRILILDLDGITAALCECSPKGVITQLWAIDTPGETDFFDALSKFTGESPAVCRRLCGEQSELIKRRYQRVLRGAGQETSLLTLSSGETLSCEDCQALLSPSLDRLERLLRESDRMLEQGGVNPDTLRILPVGALARFYPAEAALRIHFGGDALMADSRFPEPRSDIAPDELVRRGLALYENGSVEERTGFGHSVVLLLHAPFEGNKDLAVILADRDMEVEALSDGGSASPPFFVGENDALRLQVDNEQQLLALPPKLWRTVITIRLRANATDQCFLQVRDASGEEPVCLLPLRFRTDGKVKS